MNYAQEQLKSEGKLVFQRSKGQDVINSLLLLTLCALCILVPVAKVMQVENMQKINQNFCADYTASHNATPVPIVGLFDCSGAAPTVSAGDGCLYALGIAGFIVLLVLLIRSLPRLFMPNLYTFDRNANSFSLDGIELAQISDIKEVRIKQYRGFSLDIVYKDGNSERLGTFWLASAANEVAGRIADFIGKPKTDSWGFF